jgi:hypothetical protein
MAGGEPAKLWPWGKRKIGWVAEGGRGQGWTSLTHGAHRQIEV